MLGIAAINGKSRRGDVEVVVSCISKPTIRSPPTLTRTTQGRLSGRRLPIVCQQTSARFAG